MNNIVRLIVSDNITLVDVKEFIINSFDKGIRAINIFQGNNIVLFDETGNFNILVTKYNGNEITAIAVNHWNGNLYSISFDKLADIFHCNKLIKSNDVAVRTEVLTENFIVGASDICCTISSQGKFRKLDLVIHLPSNVQKENNHVVVLTFPTNHIPRNTTELCVSSIFPQNDSKY